MNHDMTWRQSEMSIGVPLRQCVGQVMSKPVITVAAGTPFKDVVRTLHRHRISAVPVTDRRGEVLGVVSEADLLRHEAEGALAPGTTTAADLMTTPALTVEPWTPVIVASRLMREASVKRLCVVDPATATLVGIVSRGDLLDVYLRSDTAIREQARLAVQRWSRQFPAEIAVSVTDGDVRLTGTVCPGADLGVLAVAVAEVDGVVRVETELTEATSAPDYGATGSST